MRYLFDFDLIDFVYFDFVLGLVLLLCGFENCGGFGRVGFGCVFCLFILDCWMFGVL